MLNGGLLGHPGCQDHVTEPASGSSADAAGRLGTGQSHSCQRCSPRQVRRTLGAVSVADQSPEPQVMVLPPDEAARRARLLPGGGDLALEDLTDDERDAFQQALAER